MMGGTEAHQIRKKRKSVRKKKKKENRRFFYPLYFLVAAGGSALDTPLLMAGIEPRYICRGNSVGYISGPNSQQG